MIKKSASKGKTEVIAQHLERIRGSIKEIGKESGLEYLVVRSDDRSVLVQTSTIDWIEAKGNYVSIHRGKESSLVRKSMRALQAELDPRRFVRVHRSAIVNVDRIRELQRMFHGEYRLILSGGAHLTLSRHYRRSFQKLVGGTL